MGSSSAHMGARKFQRQNTWTSRESCREQTWNKKASSLSLSSSSSFSDSSRVTDEDVQELKGFIDLGFRFGPEEEEDQQLCNTLPALNLYYAINRQVGVQEHHPMPKKQLGRFQKSNSFSARTNTEYCDEGWRIQSPGESPQEVKTKLRQWAQVVACSVRHSC